MDSSRTSNRTSTPSTDEDSKNDSSVRMAQKPAIDDDSTDSDENTYKSANDESEEESSRTTTYDSEQTIRDGSKRASTDDTLSTKPQDSSTPFPKTDSDILTWWYQYINSSQYEKGDERNSDEDTSLSDKMTSSMRVVQWLEGNKSSRASRRKEKYGKERRKFKKEQAILVGQEGETKGHHRHQQQQQDTSLRGPLSIRPSYVEFLQKISRGKAEPTPEELEKEWPPDEEMFHRIISTPAVSEKKEEVEPAVSRPKIDKKSEGQSAKSKKSRKSKKSSAGGKRGKKKSRGKGSVKSKSGRKGKGKKKKSIKRKGTKGSKKSGKSRSSSGKRKSQGKKKGKKGKNRKSKSSGTSKMSGKSSTRGKGSKPGDKKAQMRKSIAEAQMRQSLFAENFKKGSKKSNDLAGMFNKMKSELKLTKIPRIPSASGNAVEHVGSEQQQCNIPAAIHLYYGERADFLTEGELEEIRQKLNRQIEDKDREKRIPLIRSIHKAVMRLVGFCLKVKPSKVEDGVLDFDSHIELLDSIVTEGGRRIIIFSFHKYGPKGD